MRRTNKERNAMFAASSWPGSVLAAQGFAGNAAVGEVEDKRIGLIGRIGPITRRRELLVRPARRARSNRLHWWRRFRWKFHWSLNLIHDLSDGPFQLRILAIDY